MNGRIFVLLFGMLLAAAPGAHAAIEAYQFSSPEHEQRFQHLSETLRCLVCQNENLADSNADLARDLRSQVHKMIEDGKSDKEIVKYMTDRYGDFVLYRPPLKTKTYLLWFGPFLLALVGVFVVWRVARGSRAGSTEEQLSDEEQQRLERILHDSKNKHS